SLLNHYVPGWILSVRPGQNNLKIRPKAQNNQEKQARIMWKSTITLTFQRQGHGPTQYSGIYLLA
ncbi:MAG: hypothetical protein ACLQPD_05100, partial [Desulfomonilaceae bacterium]